MNRIAVSTDTRDKITSELKSVIREAEDLLKNAEQPASALAGNAREKIEAGLLAARKNLGKAEESLLARTRDAAQSTDQYVQEHAWQSVGVGALAGLVIGLLIGRR